MTRLQFTRWREKAGLTQEQVAGLLHVTPMSIHRWEHGMRKIPSFLHLALEALDARMKRDRMKG